MTPEHAYVIRETLDYLAPQFDRSRMEALEALAALEQRAEDTEYLQAWVERLQEELAVTASYRDALQTQAEAALDAIEAALFGDSQRRSRDQLVDRAELLGRRLAEKDEALDAISRSNNIYDAANLAREALSKTGGASAVRAEPAKESQS